MSHSRYIIGIDLGTTHSVVAYAPIPKPEDAPVDIRVFPVPQTIAPGEVKEKPLLPSYLLLPGPHDVPPGALVLPWTSDATAAVGEFARSRGAELPNRLVASAKSWLCHSGVDRTAPILPWDSPDKDQRVSPVDATGRFLAHIRDAWNHAMAGEDPDARLEAQELYLTVPASFDAVARELTVQAARQAGLERLTLLEEPQAAFYAWIESRGDRWREEIQVGESVLVCDVGGGTTDLSLIQVMDEDGELVFRRMAVGRHILLGGDNMDLTAAYAVQAKLARQGTTLDTWQFRGLWHSCRAAKERLLGDSSVDAVPVVILGRGSSLIGGTLRTELTREEVSAVLVEGFFPACDPEDTPQGKKRVGVREMGLPYESDPAITRHLSDFLGQQAGDNPSGEPVAYPSAVLFNGGVMKPDLLRNRVLDIVKGWDAARSLRELASVDLDLAVARGAAYYGLACRGRGIRIRAGASRTYYIGIESAMPSVPGIPTPIKALCVVPFGMEEGTTSEMREREFGLVVGDTAEFLLLQSTVRKGDGAGEVVEDWSGDIEEVTTMEAALPVGDEEPAGGIIPVWLESRVTEVGTLEIWCVSRDDDNRWKLEFNLRENAGA